MDRSNHTPQRIIRVDDSLWNEFGRAVGDRNRSKVIRQFIAWYLRHPGAEIPEPPLSVEDSTCSDSEEDDPNRLYSLPHALYRFTNKVGELLYVGITMDLPARMRDHRLRKPWWTEATRIDIEHFESRDEALAAERAAIKNESPLHNILHNGSLDGEGEASIA